MAKTSFKSVDEYIAAHPEDVQAILQPESQSREPSTESGQLQAGTYPGRTALPSEISPSEET
jgi:hypothetical protein